MEHKPTVDDEALIERIHEAERDRGQFAEAINDTYQYALPHRQRVDDRQTQPRDPEEEADLFDLTLQEACEDHAADLIDKNMPSYKPWVKWEPDRPVPPANKQAYDQLLDERKRKVMTAIRKSNFAAAAPEMARDMGVIAGGMLVPKTPAGQPLVFQPVLANELLMDAGPYGTIDGRWRQWHCPVRWARALFKDVPGIGECIKRVEEKNRKASSTRTTVEVCQGYHRDWEAPIETWVYCVMIDGDVLLRQPDTGSGACGLLVGRSAISHPSPWGPGPTMRMTPYGRALQMMAFLELKAAGKVVDPPFAYDHVSIQNLEQGLDAGMGFPRLQGGTIDFFPPEGDLTFATLKSEDLKMEIRRGHYLDEPVQEGKTPPTLGQWMREEARAARRVTLAQDMQMNELVIPLIQRVEHILTGRGEIEDISVNDEVYMLQAVSPRSNARDIEAASRIYETTLRVKNMFPATGDLIVDDYETAKNMVDLDPETGVVLRKHEEAPPEVMTALESARSGTRVNTSLDNS